MKNRGRDIEAVLTNRTDRLRDDRSIIIDLKIRGTILRRRRGKVRDWNDSWNRPTFVIRRWLVELVSRLRVLRLIFGK